MKTQKEILKGCGIKIVNLNNEKIACGEGRLCLVCQTLFNQTEDFIRLINRSLKIVNWDEINECPIFEPETIIKFRQDVVSSIIGSEDKK